MKNVVKVLCFTLVFIIAGTAGMFGYFRWNQSDFIYTDGSESGTVMITGYEGKEKEVVIPNRIKGKKVTKIDGLAFEESDITSIEIGRNITYIGKSVFRNCTALKTVTLGESVANIDEGAFSGCTALEEITLPKSVEKLGINVFSGCTSLKSVKFESDENFVIKDDIVFSKDMKTLYFALPYAQLGDYTCPDSVEILCEAAFSGCETLTSFKFSEKITAVKRATFFGCTKMTELVIPDSVTELGSIIVTTSAIKRITVPASVKIIDKSAFIRTENEIVDEIVIRTTKESKADIFAEENGIKVEYIK